MHPVHLILGDDELLVRRATDDLVARLADDDPELDVTTFDAAEVEQLPELRTNSLFGGRVCVVLRDVREPRAILKEAIEDYLEAPDPDAVLILTAVAVERGKKATAKIQKIRRLVDQHGQTSEVNAPPDWKTDAWQALVTAEFRRIGRSATGDAVGAILEHAGLDPGGIASRVTQVAGATEADPITIEHVEEQVSGHGRTSGFDLADAVASRDPAASITLARGLLESGVQPLAILGAIAYRIRQLQQIRAGASASDVRSSTGQYRRLQSIAGAFQRGELAWCMDRIAQLDIDLKGNSDLPPELVLEFGIIDLATTREPGAPWDPLA